MLTCSPSAAVEFVFRPLNIRPADRLLRAHLFEIQALCLRESIALASVCVHAVRRNRWLVHVD